MKKADKQQRTYSLTGLSEVSAQVLIEALELYQRIHMGQFQEIVPAVFTRLRIDEPQKAAVAEDMLKCVSRLVTGLGHSAYYGINSDKMPEDPRIAYTIQQAIRFKLAHDRNPDPGASRYSTWHDSPRQYGPEPVPVLVAQVMPEK